MAKGKGHSGGRGRNSPKKSNNGSSATPGASTPSEAGAPEVARKAVAAAAGGAGKAVAVRTGGDALKWAAVALIVVVAIGAFYALGDYSTLLRVILLLVLLGGAAFVAMRTASGASAFEFVKDSRVELRKVVWPSRKETVQTTGLILVVVVIVALFIWILDMGLGALVKVLIGGPA